MLASLIDYDRSERAYKFIDNDGCVYPFPSGAAGKGQAMKFAAQFAFPDEWEAAQRMIEDNPHLERVVFKALDILLDGGVEVFAVPRQGVVAMVMSSDGLGRYAIRYDETGYLTCQCPHFTEGDAPYEHGTLNRVCKHLAAMKLHKRTREDRF